MSIFQDLRYAGRMLVKDPWFTFVAVVALALGIGLNTTVFTLVNAVLIRGLPFDGADEIVLLATRNTTGDAENSSPASWREFEEWRSRAKSFAGVAGFLQGQMNISDPDHPAERVSGSSVSANTFRLLRQQPFLGRDFADGDDATGAAPVVVIGYQLWRNRYDRDPNAIGRPLKINEVTYTIIGVMPEGMRFPTNADLWRPLLAPANEPQRHVRNIGVFARLAPGSSWESASTEMAAISQQLAAADAEHQKDTEARLMTFNERFNGGEIRLMFSLLMGAVGFVLLIACANVANLLLARSAYRAREIALRTALGASRGRVVRQLLIESVFLSMLGGVLGLALSTVGVRLFDAAVADVGKPYWIRFTFDVTVFGYFAAVCLLTGIIFGLAPALHASKTNLNELMKEGGRGSSGGSRARWLTSSLVVAELTLTLALLTGAGLMARSFLKLYTQEFGFETAHLLTLRTQLINSKYPKPEQRQVFFDSLQQRLATLPGVTSVALASSLPLGGAGQFLYEIEGQPAASGTERPRLSSVTIGPRYFETLGVNLLQGRAIAETDGAPGSEVVVVNQRLASQFGSDGNAIGRRIRLMLGDRGEKPGPWLTVVGVSPVIRQGEVQALEPPGVVYQPYRLESPMGSALLVRTSPEPGTLTNAVREAARAIDAEQPLFAVNPLDAFIAEQRWPYKVFGSMFVIFAIIALVLSAVGVYAITAYGVTQRTPEIGVRLALGASSGQISWLILKGGLWQLGIGLGLGLIGAYGVTMGLASFVAQIPQQDPVTLVSITLLLTAVTLAACLIPARRATRLDPLKALRVD